MNDDENFIIDKDSVFPNCNANENWFFFFAFNNINISEYLSSFLICFKNMSFETRFKSSYVPLMTVGYWNSPLVDTPCWNLD